MTARVLSEIVGGALLLLTAATLVIGAAIEVAVRVIEGWNRHDCDDLGERHVPRRPF